jgi:hypothetical protein
MRFVILLLCFVILSSCGTPSEPLLDTAQELGTENTLRVDGLAPVYAPYSDDIDLQQGAILFFAKDGDPFSLKHDAHLQALYAAGSGSVSTYRVDFSTATGARIRYGVIVEDTFVVLDRSGDRIASYLHPTGDDIAALIRGRVPSSVDSSSSS